MKAPGSGKPPLDPARMFRQAEGFMVASSLLLAHSTPELQPQLGPAAVVNSAFSSEVFLKCLIRMESGQTPPGHHLDALFAMLAPTTRQEIDAHWRDASARKEATTRKIEVAMGITIPRELQDCLAAGSQAFVAIRYVYEGDGKFRFVLGDLPKILHAVILTRRPEWNVPLPASKLIEEIQFRKPPK